MLPPIHCSECNTTGRNQVCIPGQRRRLPKKADFGPGLGDRAAQRCSRVQCLKTGIITPYWPLYKYWDSWNEAANECVGPGLKHSACPVHLANTPGLSLPCPAMAISEAKPCWQLSPGPWAPLHKQKNHTPKQMHNMAELTQVRGAGPSHASSGPGTANLLMLQSNRFDSGRKVERSCWFGLVLKGCIHRASSSQ